MFNKKEIIHIILTIIVLGFVIKLSPIIAGIGSASIPLILLIGMLIATIILLINIIAKKIMARYLDATIEHKIWSFQRYGLYERSYFKKPIPIGIILPFLLGIASYGYLPWLASLQYEVKPLPSRVAKRHGLYRFSEMTEFHIGLIAATGIIASLIASIIGYLIGGEGSLFAKMSIIFACLNMLPVGKLDGNKIFFGSIILWTALAVICLIFLGYAILLPQ